MILLGLVTTPFPWRDIRVRVAPTSLALSARAFQRTPLRSGARCHNLSGYAVLEDEVHRLSLSTELKCRVSCCGAFHVPLTDRLPWPQLCVCVCVDFPFVTYYC